MVDTNLLNQEVPTTASDSYLKEKHDLFFIMEKKKHIYFQTVNENSISSEDIYILLTSGGVMEACVRYFKYLSNSKRFFFCSPFIKREV